LINIKISKNNRI